MSERYAVFKPNNWQLEVLRDQSPVVLLHGTAGSGKSRVAGEKAHAFALRYPKSSILFLRKTESSLRNTMLVPFETQVLSGSNLVQHIQHKRCYFYHNGSVIFYGGMANQKEREKIRGIGLEGGLDFVWIDEANALTKEDLNEVLARMRGRAAPWNQILLSTNPDSPAHWIYQEYVLGGKASCYYSSYKDNTYNPASYEGTLSMLTGIQLLRLKEGKWVQTEGAVYEEFDRNVHVIDSFALPPQWRRFRTIDFGYKNPFVCQWWALDSDNRMYLYRELYRTHELVEDMARLITKLSQGEKIEATITDHDAEDRATLERYGIYSIPAFKDVSPGIQAVQQRLRVQGDGKPRIYVFADALTNADTSLVTAKKVYSTEQEFGAYIYAKPKEGRPPNEDPVKENDHGMDAMRYAVAYVDKIDGIGRMPDKKDIISLEKTLREAYYNPKPGYF
jgi:phage terminase large subunit